MGRDSDSGGEVSLDVLSHPGLEVLLRESARQGTTSAWWGHVPFASWLVHATRPRTIVELGSHSGVSYFAFCQAVAEEELACACHAVDTWQGDAHTKHYGPAVYEDFARFNGAHYAAFSTAHRCTFDEALPRFADGCVDILHIDGLHTYDAVKHDFESWGAKLSPRAVVLFHDTAERRGDFGVWRLWDEVSARWPAFQFLHSHGLGVLAVGEETPAAVLELCASDAERTERLRRVFQMVGRLHSEREACLEAGLAREGALHDRIADMQSSASWRMTKPFRSINRSLRRRLRHGHPRGGGGMDPSREARARL